MCMIPPIIDEHVLFRNFVFAVLIYRVGSDDSREASIHIALSPGFSREFDQSGRPQTPDPTNPGLFSPNSSRIPTRSSSPNPRLTCSAQAGSLLSLPCCRGMVTAAGCEESVGKPDVMLAGQQLGRCPLLCVPRPAATLHLPYLGPPFSLHRRNCPPRRDPPQESGGREPRLSHPGFPPPPAPTSSTRSCSPSGTSPRDAVCELTLMEGAVWRCPTAASASLGHAARTPPSCALHGFQNRPIDEASAGQLRRSGLTFVGNSSHNKSSGSGACTGSSDGGKKK
jgi:hypothetical protein